MTLSVYVHIPFCSRRCDYCDFATWTDKEESIQKYVDTLIRQWHFHSGQISRDIELTSIFFGGGTPNLIDPKYIAKIIEIIGSDTRIVKETEITVESNPDHVTLEKMQVYAAAGVNRISMGIQSTDQNVLNFLGREHNHAHIEKARETIAKVDITNVSGDLIYGANVESLDSWQQTLQDILKLDLQHVSAYALGIEQGTPLANDVEAKLKQPTDDDDLADKYEIADQILGDNGFNWYEISNWSKPKKESKHNLIYWRGGDVVALGCAAHGYTNSNRWSTPRHIDAYIEKFSSDNDHQPIDNSMFIDRNDNEIISREQETFSLQLRTKYGVSWPSTNLSSRMLDFVAEDLVEFNPSDHKICLTVKGRLVSNSLSAWLFEEYEQNLDVVE